ncbi:MAG TPA: SpoIID/LytB domain-containing protein [Pyrinomonadaceae bacterium]|nr:SpoIID/LytB domain-containing protein [Pyrinomonadaceae bacterium]
MLAAVKKFLFPAHHGARHRLTHACVCLALLCAWTTPRPGTNEVKVAPARVRVSESELDAALQRAAERALGSRAGTIVVADAQTGRIRAAVNQQMAEASAFPPGSAIKPFTLLAALRAGVVNTDSRLSCRKHYARRGADFTCSHPVYVPPLNPTQALAHSCNYYFARLAEQLPHAEFTHTLAAYGFGAQAATQQATSPRDDGRATFKRASLKRAPATATATNASAPRLPRSDWQLSTALGEGDELLVTPLQLLSAYAALFNGGRLYQIQAADAPANFRAHEIARLDIAHAERALLLSALRGAVRYGTAAPADLASLPTHVFGKTGTATDGSDGFHTHGWFVGLASERETNPAPTHDADTNEPSTSVTPETTTSEGVEANGSRAATFKQAPAPAEVKLAVLVFLARGQGKESATVARPIFAEHARLTVDDATDEARSNSPATTSQDDFTNAPRTSNGATLVRVHLSREDVTRTLTLDEYLFGVLAAEASVEDEFAALKAQSVVSRTYALSNLRRHARDGYDFCNTTHCQRFLQVTRATSRPDFHELVRRAIRDTAGEVLRDGRGALASDVFFSTSCGGQTADIQALWGTPAREPYLRGVRDEYCTAMPHARWTDTVPAARLALALREDARTDVGQRVDKLTVVKRDATGRVEQLAIEGAGRRVVVRGWDFKIIVGRTLGWSVLKSSRFAVMRAGDKFVFRGRGFGHGLGLCQSGAHVLAARGASYRQILAYYFPATTVGGASTAVTRTTQTPTQAQRAAHNEHESAAIENVRLRPSSAAFVQASFARARVVRLESSFAHARIVRAESSFAHVAAPAPLAQGARLTLSSGNFRVSYTARGAARREVEAALGALEAARADVRSRLDAGGVAFPALGVIEVFVHETTGDFTGATGQPAWVAAATRGRRIESQPLATLARRGVLAPTLRHEYAHAVIHALSRSRAPLWLAEGLAAHVAGEGASLTRHAPREKLSLADLEKRLSAPASAAEMRALYAAAFREVGALIRAEGEANVWRRVARG